MPETALKLRDNCDDKGSRYTNLIYGYWNEGISFYPENINGAPTISAGMVLVIFNENIYYKWAFTFDGELYLITQDAEGVIKGNWFLVNSLRKNKEYQYTLSKSGNKVYNSSYYLYTIPFANADRYNISISNVVVEGMGPITDYCSIISSNALGVTIKDTADYGKELPITIHLSVK